MMMTIYSPVLFGDIDKRGEVLASSFASACNFHLCITYNKHKSDINT